MTGFLLSKQPGQREDLISEHQPGPGQVCVASLLGTREQYNLSHLSARWHTTRAGLPLINPISLCVFRSYYASTLPYFSRFPTSLLMFLSLPWCSCLTLLFLSLCDVILTDVVSWAAVSKEWSLTSLQSHRIWLWLLHPDRRTTGGYCEG